MKILAIRGENLASLAGKFEIGFERAPLKDAGLFAITGRTGAGKSTILDALCLALYDKIPRLAQTTEGVPVGRAEDDESLLVKSNDVRSILRKGCVYGAAEVDFIGCDKHRYRARWEVRRARNKATGKLQAQQVSLVDLDSGHGIGQNRTDIKQAIEERIGLTFDQFRRSVLLAQGDFAAFLKARHDERSSLLERITGTEIYSHLSIAAHERAKEESLLLTQLQDKLQDHLPLPVEQRQELEQQLAGLDTAQEQGRQQIKAIQAVLDWYKALAELEQERSRAGGELERARLDWQAAEPERLLLSQAEACQPLRPLLEHWQQMSQDLEKARAKLEQAKQRQAQTLELKNRLAGQLATAQQRLTEAERNLEQAQPHLRQARELDTRLQLAQDELASGESQLTELTAQYEQLAGKRQESLQQQERQSSELAELEAWRAAHAHYRPVAEQWQHWQAELTRYRQQHEEAAGCTRALEKNQALLDRQENELVKARSQRDGGAAEAEQLRARLESLRLKSESLSLTELSQARSRLDERLPALQRALTLVQDSERVRNRLRQNADQLTATEQGIVAERAGIARLEQVQQNHQAVLSEAKRGLQLAQATGQRTAEQLRALLMADRPCPVCGATEHPWHEPEALMARQTDAQQQRVYELEREAGDLLVQATEARHRLSAAEDRTTQIGETIAEDRSLLERLTAEWAALSLPDKPASWEDESAGPELERLLASAAAERRGIAEQERQALALQEQAQNLQRQSERMQASIQDWNRRIAALENDQTRLLAEQKSERHRLEQCRQQLQAITGLLAEPFAGMGDWQRQLIGDPERYTERCAEWVRQWRQHVEGIERLQKALETGAAEQRLLAQRLEQVGQLREAKAEQTAAQRALHRRLAEERRTLFAGTSADQAEQALDRVLRQAKRGYEQAMVEHQNAAQEFIKAEQAVGHGESELAGLSGQVRNAELKLDAALAERSLSRERLIALLEHDGAWLVRQKTYFDTLRQHQVRAEEKLKLCTEQQERHAASRPETEATEAEQSLKELQQQQQALTEQAQAKLFELKRDDERRQASRELRQALAAQQHTWQLWASLDQLIGSANGQKFRKFAQSLTLDALLGYANRHLLDFARRYRLQRAPGSDLELQVIDTDMGDEVRSVHSLSGGESFLVSLALALGLSSLAATTTPVESLFIDEGFGSLDQETLDSAMASLDTLQSLGRKVGVISHVPIMVEDIAVQVVVEKQGGGGSRVLIRG
ncbi:MAG: AAA family ATPase [Gammaproteobacteria bacterium]